MAENNQLAFDVAEREFGIQPVIRGEELAAQAEPEQLLTVLYLSKFYEAFRISPANRSGQVPSCSLLSNQARLNISLKILKCLRSAGRPGCTVELFPGNTKQIGNKILHLKQESCPTRSCKLFVKLLLLYC